MPLTKEQQKVIDELRDQGYAVAIFTPNELNFARPDRVEDEMVSSGWEAINLLGGLED